MRTVLMAAAAAGLLVSGCASSGPVGGTVLSAAPAASTARLVIYRTSPLGFAVQPNYTVNGKPVGASQPNGFVVCDLKPGKHDIGVENAAMNINFGGGSDKASLNLAGGSTTYLMAQPQMGLTVGVITISNVTPAQGKTDTANLHKTASNC